MMALTGPSREEINPTAMMVKADRPSEPSRAIGPLQRKVLFIGPGDSPSSVTVFSPSL